MTLAGEKNPMLIQHISITNFRNIKKAELLLCAGCNWVLGENGAGKTAVLEAVDVLSRGRTFRTHSNYPLIQNGTDAYQIQATLAVGKVIAVEKSKQRSETMINSKKTESRAQVAALLPLQILHPDSHHLIHGGAKSHQAFLDWGVFHTRPALRPHWVAYQRAVKQRNHLLKAQASRAEIANWDQTMVEHAEKLSGARKSHLSKLATQLTKITNFSPNFTEVSMQYNQGWPPDKALLQTLDEQYEEDLRRGHTRAGPHRATLQWLWNNMDVAKHASRGQQKLLIAAMVLAQIQLFSKQMEAPCLLLVDDIGAELDSSNQKKLLQQIENTGVQSIITTTNAAIAQRAGDKRAMFHVKHGEIIPQSA